MHYIIITKKIFIKLLSFHRVEFKGVKYEHFMKILKWIYTGIFDLPPADEVQEIKNAIMRTRVYILLSYIKNNDDSQDNNEKEKKRMRTKQKIHSTHHHTR